MCGLQDLRAVLHELVQRLGRRQLAQLGLELLHARRVLGQLLLAVAQRLAQLPHLRLQPAAALRLRALGARIGLERGSVEWWGLGLRRHCTRHRGRRGERKAQRAPPTLSPSTALRRVECEHTQVPIWSIHTPQAAGYTHRPVRKEATRCFSFALGSLSLSESPRGACSCRACLETSPAPSSSSCG